MIATTLPSFATADPEYRLLLIRQSCVSMGTHPLTRILKSGGYQGGYSLSVGVGCPYWSPARRMECAAHSALLSWRLVRRRSHGTRAAGRIAFSRSIAARSGPCRMGHGRARGGCCTDDYLRTTERPRCHITSRRVLPLARQGRGLSLNKVVSHA